VKITMKIRILCALVFAFYGVSVSAQVVDFETPQIDTCGDWGTAPVGWSIESFTAAIADMAIGSCPGVNTDGALSGTQALINFNDRVGTLVNDSGPFDLASFWIHGDDRDGGATVRIAGLDGTDGELFSTEVEATGEWHEIVLNWTSITKITWDPIAPTSSNISIDDLTIGDATIVITEPVPSLSTWSLILLAGLLGLFAFGRRRA
jgi:hypothetical protein